MQYHVWTRAFLSALVFLLLPVLLAPAQGAGAGGDSRKVILAAGPEKSSEVTEKEAFEAAKELGTIEAWEAFLENFPKGFRADLARAYVTRLGTDEDKATPPPTPPSDQAAAPPPEPPGDPDISLAMTAQGLCKGGSNCVYAITATNGGDGLYSGPLVIANSLAPGGARLTSTGSPPWQCQEMGGGAVCSNPAASLAPGQSMTLPLAFSLPPNTGGQVTGCASVSWNGVPTGSSPAEVQQALNEAGFDAGPVDGQPGRQTVNAIVAYQELFGLQQTGEIDLPLLMSLFTQPGEGDANPENDQACAGSTVTAAAPLPAAYQPPVGPACPPGQLVLSNGACGCPSSVPIWTGTSCIPRLTRNCTGGRYYNKGQRLCLCPSSKPYWYNNRCYAGVDDCPGDSVRVGDKCLKENDPGFAARPGLQGPRFTGCPANTARVGNSCVAVILAPLFNFGKKAKGGGGGNKNKTFGGGQKQQNATQPLTATKQTACGPGTMFRDGKCQPLQFTCPDGSTPLNFKCPGLPKCPPGLTWTSMGCAQMWDPKVKLPQPACAPGYTMRGDGKCQPLATTGGGQTATQQAAPPPEIKQVKSQQGLQCPAGQKAVQIGGNPPKFVCRGTQNPTVKKDGTKVCPSGWGYYDAAGACLPYCTKPGQGGDCIAISGPKPPPPPPPVVKQLQPQQTTVNCANGAFKAGAGCACRSGFNIVQLSRTNSSVTYGCQQVAVKGQNGDTVKLPPPPPNVCPAGTIRYSKGGPCVAGKCPANSARSGDGTCVYGLKPQPNAQQPVQQQQQQQQTLQQQAPQNAKPCSGGRIRNAQGKCRCPAGQQFILKNCVAANQGQQQQQPQVQQPQQQQGLTQQQQQQQQQQQLNQGLQNIQKGLQGLISDRRLKRDVELLATRPDGLKLYRFRYLWDDQSYVGVMAQDLLADPSRRDAVSLHESGYFMADYARLGLRMMTLDEWRASPVRAAH